MGDVIHTDAWTHRRAALEDISAALIVYHELRNSIPATEESRTDACYALGRVRGLRFCSQEQFASNLYWKAMGLGQDATQAMLRKRTWAGAAPKERVFQYLQGYMDAIFEVMEKANLEDIRSSP